MNKKMDTQSPQLSSFPQSPKRRRWFLILFVTLGIVVVVASVILYTLMISQRQQPSGQKESVVVPEQVPAMKEDGVATNATKQWKTFIHPQDGYSFKYPGDQLTSNILSVLDSGSGWVYSAEVVYPDRLGTFADIFIFNGSIDSAINAYYKGNNRIKITYTQSIILNKKETKIILFKDTNYSSSPIGKQYFIQYRDDKALIVAGLLGKEEKLFDKVVQSFQSY